MPRKTPTRAAKPKDSAAAAAEAASASPVSQAASAPVDAERRRNMIATAAYYIAERRGFAPGHELADWVAAEAAVAAVLAEGGKGAVRKRRTVGNKKAGRSPP
jgi:DUF2934 family protein